MIGFMTEPRYRVAVVNESESLDDLTVCQMACEVDRQVRYDFAPIWGRDIVVEYDPNPEGYDWIFKMVDRLSQHDSVAAGWHTLDDSGRVISEIKASRGIDQVSVSLSHEVLEAAGNDSVNRYAINWRDGLLYAMEVCDPVQASTYRRGDFLVSDFVTPDWFSNSRTVRTDETAFNARVRPFTVQRGGFAIRYDQQFQDRSVGIEALPHSRYDRLLADLRAAQSAPPPSGTIEC